MQRIADPNSDDCSEVHRSARCLFRIYGPYSEVSEDIIQKTKANSESSEEIRWVPQRLCGNQKLKVFSGVYVAQGDWICYQYCHEQYRSEQ